MNLKEIVLDEVTLHEPLVEEGVSAILHTILFVRAPNFVKPEDHRCRLYVYLNKFSYII